MIPAEKHDSMGCVGDFGFAEYGLGYLRNKDKEAVEFWVTEDSDPLYMVEAKFLKSVFDILTVFNFSGHQFFTAVEFHVDMDAVGASDPVYFLL